MCALCRSPATMASNMTFSRLARPFDAIRSLWGLTVTDEFKVLLALLVGYFAISASKVLKPARGSIARRFGASRAGFVNKIANIKYVLHRSPDGFYFVARPGDYWGIWLTYEPEVRRVFKPKQGDVVMDIGAHVGTYTLRHARAVGEKGLVIALEPDPENFRLLSRNINLNKLSNVIVLPMAAYESDGTSTLYRKGTGEHSLIGTNVIRIHGKSNGEIKVSTITLDTLVKRLNLDRVDWVKIDVEGAELAVLKGASNALGIIRNLIIEVWHQNADEVLDILRQKEYETVILSKGKFNRNVHCTRVNAFRRC